ncbi:MAG: hypothetical protein IKU67_02830 [Firmicutes bacterium]|nr:hypothetical protein [Bacillota bacterium]
MLREISVLAKLNLCNIYGLNVFLNNKDKKAKKVYIALSAVILLLVAMMAVYVGILVYGYVTIGLGRVIPAYLIMISSLIILMFGLFKAGSVIFERKGYDILCSLPVSSKAIVVARFIRMYVENIIFTLVVMVPGIVVYGVLMKPAMSFYFWGIIVTFLVPFAPMTLAIIIGALITAISSRTKYKSIIGAIIPIIIVVGSLAFSGRLSAVEGQITPEMLSGLAGVVTGIIENVYPPAVWLGNMMLGLHAIKTVLFVFVSFVTLGMTVYFIGSNFQSICYALYGTIAKHNFTMGAQAQSNVMVTLVKREFKRFFASTVYLSNTIMGPILAVIMSVSLFFVDLENAFEMLPVEIDFMGVLPLVIGTIFCIMNTTSTSISMEGKEWWLIKSLPLTYKQVLDAKLLMNLILFAPFYVVAVVLSIIALSPSGLDMIWMIISPAVLILFSCVWGLFVNLKVPVFNWENETSVVKQSVSALVGGICGSLVGVLMIFGLILAPIRAGWIMKIAYMVALLVITVTLYDLNNKVRLEKLT